MLRCAARRAAGDLVSGRLRVVVSGLIGQYPIGGVAWDYAQYLLGLRALGHDVVYLEDSEQWPYDARAGVFGRAADTNAAHVARVMEHFGLGDRWAYRFPGGSLATGEVFPERWFGLSDERRRALLRDADLLINVSSGVGDLARYRALARRVYVDTDPVFTQIRAIRDPSFRAHLDAHDLHWTYGECLSAAVPDTGHCWRPMRKPIALDQWRPDAARRDVFTTVMNWTSYGDVEWEGRAFGQKDTEFPAYLDLPARVSPIALELAIGSGKTRRAPRDLLERHGWRLVDPMRVCPDLASYRRYIESSAAEWTVAKGGYVEGRSGWFSGRSACYLAAGRPVVVQDTGFAAGIPVGEGVLAFASPEQAAEQIREVAGDWKRHAKAARAIAEAYFDARALVSRILDAASGAPA